MNEQADILLLSEPDMGEQLSRGLDGVSVRCVSDPYDMLLHAGQRRWSVIVLTALHADFIGLCRASRRLQSDSRLFALCTPADEPDVRPLRGEVIDDYFISPLAEADIVLLRKAAMAGTPLPAGNSRKQSASLAPGDFERLMESTSSIGKLESRVAEMVSSRIGADATWSDADGSQRHERPLLFTADDHPRVLVCDHPAENLDGETGAFISALQQCLPALIVSARRTESLHRLAVTDHLTGTYNRRYFYHLTDRVLARAAAEKFNVTLLLYDIDDFKHFNDTYGYAAGDEILRETAALMKQTTRDQDIVARIGGDEFAVLFWDDDEPRRAGSKPPETAYVLADRFRQAVSNHTFSSLGPEATGVLTISGGLASFDRDGTTCRELLKHADEAIKSAKKSGKNAIQLIG